MDFDLIIRGGTIVDGTGAAGWTGDVGVRDGRIAAVERTVDGPAARTIDARGQVVAPGFIDIKTHSDFTLPINPKAESKVRQGVTTEVIGHCGFSVAPCLPGKVADLRQYLSPSAPWLEFRETTFGDYMDSYPALSVNAVMHVGHNTLRLMTMGMAARKPTPEEIAHMAKLLEEGLEAGAVGLSSGLFTPPGSFSEPEELVVLGRVLARRGARYSTHIRDEASEVHAAVREAIAFGEACGVHVQIVHFKLSGMENWGTAETALGELAEARARGVAIDVDQYPYTAASNPLRNLLPAWLQEGGDAALIERLGRADVRRKVSAEIAAKGLNNFGRIPSWDAVRVSISPHQPQHAGKTLAEVAAERRVAPDDAVYDYVIADRASTRVVVTSIAEEDVRTILKTPFVLVGSDGNAVAPYGITSQGRPHPRFYGTFAKVLGHYVRDEKLLDLPLAVHKMTGGSAAALGIADRGVLRPGAWADITVFDPQTIAERATYADPHQYAVGVGTVVVNGTLVIDGGEHTGALPGKVLRRAA